MEFVEQFDRQRCRAVLNLEIVDSSKQFSKAQILCHKIHLILNKKDQADNSLCGNKYQYTLRVKYRISVILNQVRHIRVLSIKL